jgi:hypothetical protein
LTTDPLQSSAEATNPGSWNRYDYALSDPASRFDPAGLEPTIVTSCAFIEVLGDLCTTTITTSSGATYRGYGYGEYGRAYSINNAHMLGGWDLTEEYLNDALTRIEVEGLSEECQQLIDKLNNSLAGPPVTTDSLRAVIRDSNGNRLVKFFQGTTTHPDEDIAAQFANPATSAFTPYGWRPGEIYWRAGENG